MDIIESDSRSQGQGISSRAGGLQLISYTELTVFQDRRSPDFPLQGRYVCCKTGSSL